METVRKRLEEQKGRHQGGIKMDRHGRHSPFGRAWLTNPEGVAHRSQEKPQQPSR